jgi:hypothetical protein
MSFLFSNNTIVKAAGAGDSGEGASATDAHVSGCRCTSCNDRPFTVISPVSSKEEQKTTQDTSPQKSLVVPGPRYREAGVQPTLFRSYERPRRLKTDDRRRIERRLRFSELGSATLATQVLTATPSGNLYPLNLLAEGDDVVNRTGRLVQMDSLELRWHTEPTVPGSCLGGFVRLIVFWDKFPNQTTTGVPTVAQVLTSTGTSAVVDSSTLFGNMDRFMILHDEVRYCGGDMSASEFYTAQPHGLIRINLKGSEYYSQYSSTGSTYNDLVHGGLVFLVAGSKVAGSGVTVSYESRVRFIE